MSNLAKLAKGNNKKLPEVVKKPQVKSIIKPKVVEVKLTPEEERDIKAKQKVEELLQGVDLTINPSANVEEVVDENTPQSAETNEWLEEQAGLLSDQTEILRSELAIAREDYARLYENMQNSRGGNSNGYENETMIQNILTIYNELDSNLRGKNAEGQIWTTVDIRYLLNQMNQLFPFTARYK